MKTASDRSIDNQLVDGLRLDTAKHVGKSFWASFTSAAGVFSTGEVFDPDAGFVCDYQNHMPSVLNYPAYYAFNSFLSSTSGNTRSLLNAISNLVHLITRSAARFYALQTLKTRVSDIALPTYTTLSYAPHSNVDERQSTLDLDMKLPILSNSLPFAT